MLAVLVEDLSEFNSQAPHDSSQLSLATDPGDPTPSSGLRGHQAAGTGYSDLHTGEHTHRQNIHTHEIKINLGGRCEQAALLSNSSAVSSESREKTMVED